MMKQIERIQYMETLMEEIVMTIQKKKCIEDIKDKIKELEEYYSSPLWLYDYDCDRNGKLADDLKRGVLSEDGIYTLLEMVKEIEKEMYCD